MLKFKSTLEGFVEDPFILSKPHVSKFSPLEFMGLVHEPITYIFNNKINYLFEDFMSLEVLVMASLSCDQNLGKKGIYCSLAFRCQPLGTIHVRVGNGTGGQLLIWFGSLVAS